MSLSANIIKPVSPLFIGCVIWLFPHLTKLTGILVITGIGILLPAKSISGCTILTSTI